MFSNRSTQEYLSRDYLWLWLGLAFQAGFVNAGGFLACARFVSHVTGFGTSLGMTLSQMDYALALEMCSAPLSFLLGAIVSGLAVDRQIARGRKPRYRLVMSGQLLIFAFITIAGELGWLGEFGEPLLLERDFALMALLCFACGMQNACFTSLTKGQIRTTHLTGILTDIGINLVRIANLGATSRDSKILRRANFIRIMTFVSFSTGSALAAILFSNLAYLGFTFVIGTSAALLLGIILRERQIHRVASQIRKSPVVKDSEPIRVAIGDQKTLLK